MRKMIVIAILGFAITLAAVIGTRMSTEAMAVAIGVVFGVAAGIPTSLLIAAAIGRQGAEPITTSVQTEPYGDRRREWPPVIVVNPGGQHPSSTNYGGYAAPWPLSPAFVTPTPRQVHYVGEEPASSDEW